MVSVLLLAFASLSPRAGCDLPDASRTWLQSTLDDWLELARDMGQEPDHLPWMVVFDARCTWHLAGDSARLPVASQMAAGLRAMDRDVAVFGLEHTEMVKLPGGDSIPAAPIAFTSLRDDGVPWFVVALPDVWAAIPGIEKSVGGNVGAFVRGLVAHEMTHTLQVAAVAAQIDSLGSRFSVPPDPDDDIVQTRFSADSTFGAMLSAERAVYGEAIEESDVARKKTLVRRALAMTRDRQERFFTGVDAVYGPLEALFLDMEGAAIMAHYRLHLRHPDRVAFVQTRANPPWSQGFGFQVFRLIDQLAPGWPDRVFTAHPAGPFELLAEAVDSRD